MSKIEQQSLIAKLLALLGYELESLKVLPGSESTLRYSIGVTGFGNAEVAIMKNSKRISISFQTRRISPGFRLYSYGSKGIGRLLSSS